MTQRGATITMKDMVDYYDRILANPDLSDRERQYITGLRDETAGGTLAISSQVLDIAAESLDQPTTPAERQDAAR